MFVHLYGYVTQQQHHETFFCALRLIHITEPFEKQYGDILAQEADWHEN